MFTTILLDAGAACVRRYLILHKILDMLTAKWSAATYRYRSEPRGQTAEVHSRQNTHTCTDPHVKSAYSYTAQFQPMMVF